MSETITSPANPLVKKVRKVLGGQRAFSDLCAVEGIKVVEEALTSAVVFDTVIITDRLDAQADGRALLRKLQAQAAPITTITPPLLGSLSEIGAHQGILALVRRPTWSEADLLSAETPWLAVLDGVQDPGNLGTVLRTGEAAGISGVIACAGTVDPFNAKSVRASMGSVFRVPLQTRWSAERTLTFLKEHGLRVIAAARRAGIPYTEADLTGPLAMIFGSEGHGLTDAMLRAADTRVSIPMSERVDSLNVALSAAIFLYEARRQRARSASSRSQL